MGDHFQDEIILSLNYSFLGSDYFESQLLNIKILTVILLKDTVRSMFSSVILLCNVHVERHLRMKVIHTSRWRDQQQDWLTMEDKNEIIKKFLEVRDAPTYAEYMERKNELLELTEGLLVKPANSFNEEDNFYSDEETVTFQSYYENKWEPIVEMWVYAHRKKFPLTISMTQMLWSMNLQT